MTKYYVSVFHALVCIGSFDSVTTLNFQSFSYIVYNIQLHQIPFSNGCAIPLKGQNILSDNTKGVKTVLLCAYI